jgi:hypothetical protein
VIEVVAWLVIGCALGLSCWVGLGLVGDSRDSRRYNRAREQELRERHVRTLEWELDVEPYPWGSLDD